MQFDVLGPLRVTVDGENVELGAFKQRSLLALLLIHRRHVVSTDRIIDELWGDDTSTDHHGALWVHLSNLRSALEPDRPKGSTGSFLLTRSPGYLLDVDHSQIDAGEFEDLLDEGRRLVDDDPSAASLVLAESLELWRGYAYEDFAYESFAQVEIARLNELRMEAVETRIDADLRRGLGRELIGELEALTREHPLRERLVGQLMVALYRAGRQAEALRRCTNLRSMLAEELGVEPSPEIAELEEQILLAGPDLMPAESPKIQVMPEAVRGYELREELGRSDLGVVRRAFQPSTGREVAIKIIPPDIANDTSFIRSFEVGVNRIAERDRSVVDYWREPGGAYLVMPLTGTSGDRTVDGVIETINRVAATVAGESSAVADAEPDAVGDEVDIEIVNPYKGLRAFDEGDEDTFFGRERLVERLVNRLAGVGNQRRFVALVGPSGSGKSSVVKAGVLPALRAGAIPGSEDWFITEMSPGSQPFSELETALLKIAVDPPSTMLDQLRAAESGLRRLAERILPDDSSQVLLVIDQLEELFTQTQREADRRFFLDALVEALNSNPGHLHAITTLRADFYDRPLRYHEFGEMLRIGTQVITPMSPEELERAVAAPGEMVGVALEPGLSAAVVSDVFDEPAALPLMQYAMTELFERRQGATMRLDNYRQLGGVAGALSRRAEELYDLLDEPGREAARQIFLQLISLGEDEEDTRRRVLTSELARLGTPSSIGQVLDVYGRHRLLTFDRDPISRGPAVEIAHEALLSEWPRYRRWVEEARDDLRKQRRLARSAADWTASDQDRSYLLTGSRLDEAVAWRQDTDLVVKEQIDRYIAKSLEHEAALQHSRQRRRRIFGGAIGLVATVALSLLVFGLTQQSAAERLASVEWVNRLVESAEDALAVDPELALLLGVEAAEEVESLGMEPFPKNLEVLHEGLAADRLLFTVDDITSAAVASDSSVLYAGRPDGGITTYHPTTGTEQSIITPPDHPSFPRALALSDDEQWLTDGRFVIDLGDPNAARPIWPGDWNFSRVRDVDISGDGSYVAVADFIPGGPSGIVAVWDIAAERELWEAELGAPVRVDFHPEGGLMAVASEAGAIGPEVVIFDVATGEVVDRIAGSQNLKGVQFHPDGDRLVIGETSVRQWNLDSETFVNLDPGHAARVSELDFNVDGSLMASGDEDGVVVVTETATGRALFELPRHEAGLRFLEIGSEGHRLTTVTSQTELAEAGQLRVFDIGTDGAVDLATFDTSLPRLSTVDIHLGGDLITVGADDPAGSRQIWSLSDGLIHELPKHAPLGLPLGVNGPIAFSPDGSTIATGDASSRIRLWDSQTGEVLVDRELRDIVPNLGDTFGRASGFGEHILAVEYDPTGERIGFAGAGFVVVADATTLDNGVPIYAHDIGWTDRIAFSHDGKAIAAGANPGRTEVFANPVTVFETATGAELASWSPDTLVTSLPVDFSPAGDLLAVGSDRVVIRDAESFEALRGMRAESISLRDVEFGPEGNRLAVSYADGTIILWDPHSGERLYTLVGHEGAASDIDWTAEGARLVSVGDDGLIKAYLLDPEGLIDLARSRVTRRLTDEECNQYLGEERC